MSALKEGKWISKFSFLWSRGFWRTELPEEVKPLSLVRLFATLWTVAYQAPPPMGFSRLLHPWDFPGKSTGVGCHFLLQGIFPTQGSNPGLPYCRQTLYRLNHQGSHYLLLNKMRLPRCIMKIIIYDCLPHFNL